LPTGTLFPSSASSMSTRSTTPPLQDDGKEDDLQQRIAYFQHYYSKSPIMKRHTSFDYEQESVVYQSSQYPKCSSNERLVPNRLKPFLLDDLSLGKIPRIAGIIELQDKSAAIRWQESSEFTFHQDLGVDPTENRFSIALFKKGTGFVWGYSTHKKLEYALGGFGVPQDLEAITSAIDLDLKKINPTYMVFGCIKDIHAEI